MIEVHHLEHSRSQRIIWLLEELGLPYKVKRYARDAKTYLAPPELLKIHPLGKSPVITDGDITVAESGAIVEYLIDKAGGKFRPAAGTQAHRDYTYWMHFAEGTAMPPLVMTLVFNKIENAPVPALLKPIVLPIARGISKQVKSSFINPNLEKQFAYIESVLAKNEWFCGSEMTGADFMMSFPLEATMSRAESVSSMPKIAAYVKRIHAMPSFKKALEVGGPYNYA
ncbi:MAG: glutathione S-transferase [Limnobacter sp. CACIAM 66H1]|uniref:glutathione S-transferase n=1 Tax=Limnobacter sp. CACIAM 66H1 TaxID=1813033 RepID=UPI0007A8F219|nr:glutathione S-transferase [Limnobacter sp. CACIAM 66H1]KYP10128.1 MAG: glutathione S-transferase [Limnobacter sp. CACIAM 66H1]